MEGFRSARNLKRRTPTGVRDFHRWGAEISTLGRAKCQAVEQVHWDDADSVALLSLIRICSLSCLAAARSSGCLGAVSVETPGRVQQAAAIVGFVFRAHRGCEAVQGNAATKLMAIHVCLSWV